MARVTLQRARPRRVARLGPLLVLLAVAGVAAAALVGDRSLHGGPPAAPPGLSDLWAGRAALVLDRKWTSTELGTPAGGAWAGAHVEIAGGRWYLFNRRAHASGCPGHGADFVQAGTQVRASQDGGATWGAPAEILAPRPGTPWACAATDGDAFYDPGTRTWGYLFQCLGDGPGWNGCYARRRAEIPFGEFTADGSNPVIASGDLWSRICDDAGDGCARGAGEEGTFDVFAFDGEGWWVGFHGYEGAHGYRGIARTTSFERDGWQVDGAGGTPPDAVLDAADAAGWHESWNPGGPIGAGAGSILEERGWYYQLAEVADLELECTPGQNWDLGLFRTRRLASVTWAQYPAGNPVVYSGRGQEGMTGPERCSVGYPRLFRDPESGITYLTPGRRSADPAHDAIYVYRLEWDRNLVANGDFGSADTEGWQALAGTSAQLSARRFPEGSPDGTPYLAFNLRRGVRRRPERPPGRRRRRRARGSGARVRRVVPGRRRHGPARRDGAPARRRRPRAREHDRPHRAGPRLRARSRRARAGRGHTPPALPALPAHPRHAACGQPVRDPVGRLLEAALPGLLMRGRRLP
jgi:hypothetical protein